MALASIIISAYNQALFIRDAVDSALAQTHPDLEVIVVDDGSSDGTRQTLDQYKSHVNLLFQENRGLSATRNRGFAASHGENILFLDGDDILHREMVARLASMMDSQPETGLVYSAWQQVNEDGTQIIGEVRPEQQGQVLERLLLRRFFFYASSALIRRSALERVGLFDESLPWGEDSDLWLRLAKAGFSFGYLDQPLLKYRIHFSSMTSSVNPGQVDGWAAGLRKFFADPDLPAHITALEAEATSILHFETAGRYCRVGDVERARFHLHQALTIYPAIEPDWLLEWLAGTALDPRTKDPEKFLEITIDQLNKEMPAMASMRRRAHGRYHTAAIFSAFSRGDYKQIRQHLLPAITGDPSVLRNRGFLRIAAGSLFA